MAREWVDHTSELELHVQAPSAAGAVAEATEALGEVLGEPDAGADAVDRALTVEARDAAGLLAAWLEEVVFLAEHDRLIARTARDLDLDDGELRGRVVAAPGTPSNLVKAVTYHRLMLEPAEDGGGWRARVVLDV
jgi:SHS2 domain-containing protein